MLGERIRKYRLENDLSQADLSKKAGVSIHSISNIENGSDFNIDNLLSLLRALRIINNIDFLIPDLGTNPFDVAKGISCRQRRRHYKWFI